MTWTTPATFKPGKYAGEAAGMFSFQDQVSDNLQYLKDNKSDPLATQSSPSRALDTTYQAGGYARIVTIACTYSDVGNIALRVGSSATYTNNPIIAGVGQLADAGHPSNQTITFVVPPGYYYRAIHTDDVVLQTWKERDLGI